MSITRKVCSGLAALGLLNPSASADDSVTPAGGQNPQRPLVAPLFPNRQPRLVQPCPCPPTTILPPGTIIPLPPGTTLPTMPPTTTPPTTTPPTTTPPTPQVPTTPSPTDSFAGTQPGLGGSGSFNFTPNVFGDLLGGGAIAGPLPVKMGANGQIVGVTPVIVLPNGQRVTVGTQGTPRTITDEALLGRRVQTSPTQPGGYVPPSGTVFSPELAPYLARIPQVQYGAFKITENDTPRPTTRAYFTYNYYDQVLNNFGGPDVPRISVHQEIFGYEQAFADNRFSVGIRVPYTQLVSPGFYNDTSLGNITLITKAVILDDVATGCLLSGGFVVTAPTGNAPLPSTLTGQTVNSTLLQPYIGYIWRRGDFFAQGFSSFVAPTDPNDVTIWANDLALGYFAYKAPGSLLSAVVPVLEGHLTNPLNHRGSQVNPVGFVDQLTVLGGIHMYFMDRSNLGFAVGAPFTGPRPFSLQATIQFNCRF